VAGLGAAGPAGFLQVNQSTSASSCAHGVRVIRGQVSPALLAAAPARSVPAHRAGGGQGL